MFILFGEFQVNFSYLTLLFQGTCVQERDMAIVTEFMSRGSLRDVLNTTTLDWKMVLKISTFYSFLFHLVLFLLIYCFFPFFLLILKDSN